jgi:hypothetical protein
MSRNSVKARSVRTTPPRPRRWRVSIIRQRGEYLGAVEAANEQAAEAVAAEQFHLNDQQRKRLVLREVA